MNLALIGYRGTGKTTIAQRLGLRLGWRWIDADVEIELLAGKSIAAIFAEQGEPGFRDLESAVLQQLAQKQHVVLALGGGAVLRPENRAVIQGLGPVIWLQADPQTIHDRVAQDATTAERRPNLTVKGGVTEIEELLAQRAPIYRQCCDLAVDTAGRSPDEVAAEIMRRLSGQLHAKGHHSGPSD